jgi:hypothetical protein
MSKWSMKLSTCEPEHPTMTTRSSLCHTNLLATLQSGSNLPLQGKQRHEEMQ